MNKFLLAGMLLLYSFQNVERAQAVQVQHDFEENPQDLYYKLENVRVVGLEAAARGTNIPTYVQSIRSQSDRGIASVDKNDSVVSSVTNVTNNFISTSTTDRSLGAGANSGTSIGAGEFKSTGNAANAGGVGSSVISIPNMIENTSIGTGKGILDNQNEVGAGSATANARPTAQSIDNTKRLADLMDSFAGINTKVYEAFSASNPSPSAGVKNTKPSASRMGPEGADGPGAGIFKTMLASREVKEKQTEMPASNTGTQTARAAVGGGGANIGGSTEGPTPSRAFAPSAGEAEFAKTFEKKENTSTTPTPGKTETPPVNVADNNGARGIDPNSKHDPKSTVQPAGTASAPVNPVDDQPTSAPTGAVFREQSSGTCQVGESNKCESQCAALYAALDPDYYPTSDQPGRAIVNLLPGKTITEEKATVISDSIKAMQDSNLCCPKIYGISWGQNNQLKELKLDFAHNNATENVECMGLSKLNAIGEAPSVPKNPLPPGQHETKPAELKAPLKSKPGEKL